MLVTGRVCALRSTVLAYRRFSRFLLTLLTNNQRAPDRLRFLLDNAQQRRRRPVAQFETQREPVTLCRCVTGVIEAGLSPWNV